jgi:hypothetical protein
MYARYYNYHTRCVHRSYNNKRNEVQACTVNGRKNCTHYNNNLHSYQSV